MLIPKKYYGLWLGACMSFFMTLTVSFILNLLKVGFCSGFVAIWLKNWITLYSVAFPVSLVLGPIARRVADALTVYES